MNQKVIAPKMTITVCQLIHLNDDCQLCLLLWLLQKISQVACGWRHTLALSEKKNVFSWGRGTSGQLGNGEIVDRWFLSSARAQCLLPCKTLVNACVCYLLF